MRRPGSQPWRPDEDWALHVCLSKPLTAMERAITRLLNGDAERVPGQRRRDEIGRLARAMTAIHDKGLEAARLKQAVDSAEVLLMVAEGDGYPAGSPGVALNAAARPRDSNPAPLDPACGQLLAARSVR